MNLPFHLACRLYSQDSDAKRISRPAIRIATFGVALGVAVMLISVAVVIGFKHEIRQKVVGMSGHVQVFNDQITQDYESLPIFLNDSALLSLNNTKGVVHTQRYCNKPGMLKTDESFDGVVLKGYGKDYDTSFLRASLLEGSIDCFLDSCSSNKIIISSQLSQRLKLSVGDNVYAYFFDKNVRTRHFKIIGIYSTNIKEFDNNTVFTDLYTVRRLCGFDVDECSGVEITIDNYNNLDEIDHLISQKVATIREQSGYPCVAKTVQQLYAPMFSWLSLLDTNIWVILVLMTAVASFTMISGLLIIILEKTQFIGTMKALGASNGLLRHVFLNLSMFIIGKGIILGNVIGLGLIFLQLYSGIIRLDAENYYLDRVPVELNWFYVFVLNVSTAIISLLVLIVPSYLVSRIRPARSIRFE